MTRIEKGGEGGWPDAFEKSSDDKKRIVLETSQPSKTAIEIIRSGPLGKDGPILYNARYGGGDHSEVRRWKLTGPNLDKLEELPEDQGKSFYKGYTDYNIVSFCLGPDGALYYTDSNQSDSKGTNFRLGRIRFVNGVTPVADFKTSATTGSSPLEVLFTDSSTISKGQVTSWAWDFGDGETSTQKDPKHTYKNPGVYTATLKASGDSGLNQSKQVSITVSHHLTLQLKGSIADARTSGKGPAPLTFPVDLHVYHQDGLTPLAFDGGKGPDQNVLRIPIGGKIDASFAMDVTEPGMTFSVGESAPDGIQAVWVGVPLSLSSSQDSVSIAPVIQLSNTTIRGRILDSRHKPAKLGIKLSKGPDTIRSESDVLGYYHFAASPDLGYGTFNLETEADNDRYGIIHQEVQVNEGKATVQNLTIGLVHGGLEEADLSKIPATPNIDFEKQIQPIFTSSCVACHNGIATNTGGLDLSPGKSLQSILNHTSPEAPGIKWVEPGAPDRSYLMEKINAMHPQVGTSMRPGDPMPLQQRALIRDWIQQLSQTP